MIILVLKYVTEIAQEDPKLAEWAQGRVPKMSSEI
jgi:hypothetical protein